MGSISCMFFKLVVCSFSVMALHLYSADSGRSSGRRHAIAWLPSAEYDSECGKLFKEQVVPKENGRIIWNYAQETEEGFDATVTYGWQHIGYQLLKNGMRKIDMCGTAFGAEKFWKSISRRIPFARHVPYIPILYHIIPNIFLKGFCFNNFDYSGAGLLTISFLPADSSVPITIWPEYRGGDCCCTAHLNRTLCKTHAHAINEAIFIAREKKSELNRELPGHDYKVYVRYPVKPKTKDSELGQSLPLKEAFEINDDLENYSYLIDESIQKQFQRKAWWFRQGWFKKVSYYVQYVVFHLIILKLCEIFGVKVLKIFDKINV